MERYKLVDPAGKQFGVKTFYPEPLVKGVFSSNKTGNWYRILKINKATKKAYCKRVSSASWSSILPIGGGRLGRKT